MNFLNNPQTIDQFVAVAQHVAVFVLQSAIICAAGLLLAASLKKRGPFVRSIVYRMTVVAVMAVGVAVMLGVQSPRTVVLLPDAHSVPVPVQVTVQPSVETPAESPQPVTTIEPGAKFAKPSAAAATYAEPPVVNFSVEQASKKLSVQQWAWIAVLVIWAFGTIRMLVRTLSAYLRLRKLRGTACPNHSVSFEFSLAPRFWRSRPVVLVSDSVSSPFLCGVFRPTVFLPTGLYEQLDTIEFNAILRHEEVHVSRNDCAWRLVLNLTCAVAWPNPLLWVLSRNMEISSEESVDQLVLSSGCVPRDYANTLLRVVESFAPTPREALVGSGVVSGGSEVRARIVQILRFEALPPPIRTGFALGFLCFAAGCAAAAMTLVNRTPVVTSSWTPPPGYMSHFTEAGFPSAVPVRVFKDSDEITPALIKSYPGNILTASAHERPGRRQDMLGNELILWNPDGKPLAMDRPAQKVITGIRKLIDHSTSPAFAAEYALSGQYLERGEMSAFSRWLSRSYQDAPAIIVGRVQSPDGRPISRTAISFSVNYYTESPKIYRLVDPYNIQTDSDGRFAIPVYCGPVSFGGYGYLSNAGFSGYVANKLNKSAFEVKPGVNVIPPMVVHPHLRWAVVGSQKASNSDSPAAMTGRKIKLAWAPYPGATKYAVTVSNTTYTKSGLQKGYYWLSSPPTSTNFTHIEIPVDSTTQSNIDSNLYFAIVTASNENGDLAESEELYVRMVDKYKPIPLTISAIQQVVPPGLVVESISKSNSALTVVYDRPLYWQGEIPDRFITTSGMFKSLRGENNEIPGTQPRMQITEVYQRFAIPANIRAMQHTNGSKPH